jgi:XTP/dITP diphosphohydrolase
VETQGPREIVLASGNVGKLRELGALLAPEGFILRPQSQWGFAEAIEDGLTFVENALKKARHAAANTGLPAIADDSGLVVPALGGEPGIYSARYAGPGAGDVQNNEKLLRQLAGQEAGARRAYFHCAMVLVRHAADPVPLIASASWWGEIAQTPRGAGGFGYDPLFWLAEQGCTSAELPPEEKNRISHRGQAAQSLLSLLRGASADLAGH